MSQLRQRFQATLIFEHMSLRGNYKNSYGTVTLRGWTFQIIIIRLACGQWDDTLQLSKMLTILITMLGFFQFTRRY